MFARVLQRGFTIVEILIATVIIGILAGIGVAGYHGIQYRAADSRTHNDAKSLQSLIESDRLIKNSYAPELSGLEATPSINSAVLYTTNAQPYPVYANLTTDQNAELLLKVCNDIASISPYSVHLDLCMFSGNNINLKGTSCTVTIKGPLLTSLDLNFLKLNCSVSANLTLATANVKILAKFLEQGGTFPVTMPSGNTQPALPEPQTIQSRASAYCLEVRSTLYLSIVYSTNSNSKTVVKGPCTETLPPLPPHLML